ncbi:hypothetical protein ACQKWADRAFT_288292 [Trichoderma austrokoningii]
MHHFARATVAMDKSPPPGRGVRKAALNWRAEVVSIEMHLSGLRSAHALLFQGYGGTRSMVMDAEIANHPLKVASAYTPRWSAGLNRPSLLAATTYWLLKSRPLVDHPP